MHPLFTLPFPTPLGEESGKKVKAVGWDKKSLAIEMKSSTTTTTNCKKRETTKRKTNKTQGKKPKENSDALYSCSPPTNGCQACPWQWSAPFGQFHQFTYWTCPSMVWSIPLAGLAWLSCPPWVLVRLLAGRAWGIEKSLTRGRHNLAKTTTSVYYRHYFHPQSKT